MKFSSGKTVLFTLAILLLPHLLPAADMEITPFRTINLSPLAMIHPLPAETSSVLAPRGRLATALTYDRANNFTHSSSSNEQIILDGESDRVTLSARYGVTDSVEVGIELPLIVTGGGFLDSFIIDWHNTFGMPQGGRDSVAKNRLLYSYGRAGQPKLFMDTSGAGLADIVLTGAVQLYEEKSSALHDTIALRSTLKLPTGDSSVLRGSGAFGGTISLCGGSNHFTRLGTVAVFGSVGAMVSAKGDVLKDQQEPFAALGTFGLGWGAAPWISFKVQLNGNTRLYSDSALPELSRPAFMLVSGGALNLPGNYLLDIGVSEDISVGTAPDVAFHLALSKLF